MVVVVEVRAKEKGGCCHGGEHDSTVSRHAAAFDEAVTDEQQNGAGAIERGVYDGKDRVLWGHLHHAAGLVVRRLTIKKARANMKAENRTRVAMDADKGNSAGLAG